MEFPVHGYVVMTTLGPLSTTDYVYNLPPRSFPAAGQLLFTGDNGSKARVTFTGGGRIRELDATGSGTFLTMP